MESVYLEGMLQEDGFVCPVRSAVVLFIRQYCHLEQVPVVMVAPGCMGSSQGDPGEATRGRDPQGGPGEVPGELAGDRDLYQAPGEVTRGREDGRWIRLPSSVLGNSAPLRRNSMSSTDRDVMQCCLPAAVLHGGLVITSGLCSVLRHIVKTSHTSYPERDVISLLGHKSLCLKSCAEVSPWTRFCEIEIIRATENILSSVTKEPVDTVAKEPQTVAIETPAEIQRLERHLNEPAIIANIGKRRRLAVGRTGKILPGVTQVQEGVTQVQEGGTQVQEGVTQVQEGVTQVQEGGTQVQEGGTQIQEGVRTEEIIQTGEGGKLRAGKTLPGVTQGEEYRVTQVQEGVRRQGDIQTGEGGKLRAGKSSVERGVAQGEEGVRRQGDIQTGEGGKLSAGKSWVGKGVAQGEVDRETKQEGGVQTQEGGKPGVQDREDPLGHNYAEGTDFTLTDLVLFFCVRLMTSRCDNLLSLTPKVRAWYSRVLNREKVKVAINMFNMDTCENKHHVTHHVIDTDHVIDSGHVGRGVNERRHGKKKFRASPSEVARVLEKLGDLPLRVSPHPRDVTALPWDSYPRAVLPGDLPPARAGRKLQQLESVAGAVLGLARPGDTVVDFCAGGGHLGILVAYLLPACRVVLVENKEESVLRALPRAAALPNLTIYQANLGYYTGGFQLGMCLHACGGATDLVLGKCVRQGARFVVCPCCYGSIGRSQEEGVKGGGGEGKTVGGTGVGGVGKEGGSREGGGRWVRGEDRGSGTPGGWDGGERLDYPRSKAYRQAGITYEEYLVLGHGGDQNQSQKSSTPVTMQQNPDSSAKTDGSTVATSQDSKGFGPIGTPQDSKEGSGTVGTPQDSKEGSGTVGTPQGVRCMIGVDSDRARHAIEHGYDVTLCKLQPETCSPKNNILIGTLASS